MTAPRVDPLAAALAGARARGDALGEQLFRDAGLLGTLVGAYRLAPASVPDPQRSAALLATITEEMPAERMPGVLAAAVIYIASLKDRGLL